MQVARSLIRGGVTWGICTGAEQAIVAAMGGEAVAAAIRMALLVTGRQWVIKFEGDDHGWSDGVFASVTNDPVALVLPAWEAAREMLA
jgi:glutamate-1-semialdehyde 2,1-aminomutase